MGAPGIDDVAYVALSAGTPADDTGAWGGDLTSTALTETASNLLIANVYCEQAGGADHTFRGAAARKNNASGKILTCGWSNRAGAIFPSGGGVVSWSSTDSRDTGAIVETGKLGGIFAQETISNTSGNGTTTTTGSTHWDTGLTYRHEYAEGGVWKQPWGNITITVAGQVVGVIYGKNSVGGTDLQANWLATVEFEIALALAKNVGIYLTGTTPVTNRLTEPGGGQITAWSRPVYWTGLDTRLATPVDGNLNAGDALAFAVRLTTYAGIPAPLGPLLVDVQPSGLSTP